MRPGSARAPAIATLRAAIERLAEGIRHSLERHALAGFGDSARGRRPE